MSEIQEVYERFKHLDHLLSDPEWIDESNLLHHILQDLWREVKREALARDGDLHYQLDDE